MKTVGLSPKVVAATITGVVVYLLTKLAIPVDPIVEQAINVAAVILAAVIAGPGEVAVDPAKVPASDELLSPDVEARIRAAGDEGYVELEGIIRLAVGVLVLLVVLWVIVVVVQALV